MLGPSAHPKHNLKTTLVDQRHYFTEAGTYIRFQQTCTKCPCTRVSTGSMAKERCEQVTQRHALSGLQPGYWNSGLWPSNQGCVPCPCPPLVHTSERWGAFFRCIKPLNTKENVQGKSHLVAKMTDSRTR